MSRNVVITAVLLITFLSVQTSAQFKIPKIPKPTQPKPQPSSTPATPASTGSTQPATAQAE